MSAKLGEGRLRDQLDQPVPALYPLVERRRANPHAMGDGLHRQARQPVLLQQVARYGLRKGGMRTTYLTEVVEVHEGETLNLPGGPQIIGLPGHSEGSIAIYVPTVDAVFVGDGLTTRHVLTGKEGPQPAPFTDEPDQAIASLRVLIPTGAKWVLPGHGAPWSGGVEAAVVGCGKSDP